MSDPRRVNTQEQTMQDARNISKRGIEATEKAGRAIKNAPRNAKRIAKTGKRTAKAVGKTGKATAKGAHKVGQAIAAAIKALIASGLWIPVLAAIVVIILFSIAFAYVGKGDISSGEAATMAATATGDGRKDTTAYSQEDLELLWAIVGQEDSTSYEGALAVITCAMNRADQNYGGYGQTAKDQLTADGQFCYSPKVSDPSYYQARLNGNVADFVKQAVADCLQGGKRNHNFLNFRSKNNGSRTQIGGNWYF